MPPLRKRRIHAAAYTHTAASCTPRKMPRAEPDPATPLVSPRDAIVHPAAHSPCSLLAALWRLPSAQVGGDAHPSAHTNRVMLRI